MISDEANSNLMISNFKNTKDHFSVVGIHYETNHPVRVVIKNGIIQELVEDPNISDSDSKLYIAPGLVDNQVNGYANIDFTGDKLTTESIAQTTKALWKYGVTTFFPTLISNSHENLIRNFKILAGALKSDYVSSCIPLFHLEGPYISPEQGFRGCHPVEHIRKPSWEEFLEYQKAADGKIGLVTLAPEIEGAMEFISMAVKNQVVVAMGHTNASAELINLAADKGVRLSVHLGNGCANIIHRHHNPIWPQLANDKLATCIIADGHHLIPEEMIVFYRLKGPDHLILSSDITCLAGMPSGKYMFAGSEVFVTEEGVLRNLEQNCLAGASLPLITGIENMIKIVGCSLPQAINLASTNVASVFGLSDRGSLTPGKRADLILFEKTGYRINIRKTYLSGEVVFTE
jgi:N-acetylglucosamine-6-phosphate deacetylase